MPARGLALLLVLTAALAWPQAAPALEIHGVVTEVGLNLGVAGAEVTLYEFVRSDDVLRTVFATTATDAKGAFQFHPIRSGDYYVEVRKPGYFATISPSGSITALPENTGTPITVSPAHPSQQVRFALMRPAELTGHVIDDDDKPVARLAVQIAMAGVAPPDWRLVGVTDQNGSISAKKLIPGDYLVKVSSAANDSVSVIQKFSEADAALVDEELETFYWPGVPDERSASPLRVSPGGPANMGTIRIRKTPSYRAHVSMTGCQPDDRPQFTVSTAGGRPAIVQDAGVLSFLPSLTVASCRDFLVRGLKPGSYQFGLTSRGGWAEASVEINNRNPEITLTMSPVVDVAGRFVAGEGVTMPPLDKVRITLVPVDRLIRLGAASSPDAKGAFLLRGISGPRHSIRLTGLTSGYYVKELRVDGRVVPDGTVALGSGSRLEIVLDDQPAAINGVVTDGDNPFPQPLIVVAQWPMLEGTESKTTGDNEGRFRISGLPPGDYRILAVPSAALPDGQQIESLLSKLWASAEKITLERGGVQNLTLKLIDPLALPQ